MTCFINFFRKHVIATVVVASAIGVFIGYYNSNLLTPNGVYVVLGNDLIPAEGNIQVDQLEKVIKVFSHFGVKIPNDCWISASQGYERFIPNTTHLGLVYYKGLDSGDAYSVNIKFLSKKGQFDRFYSSKNYGNSLVISSTTTNAVRLSAAESAAIQLAAKQQ